MKSLNQKYKYIKLCLISPALEIFINIIYISSFLIIFTYFWINGKHYNDNQILKFTESYLNYNSFNSIKTPIDFEIYLSNLVNKIYTIDTSKDILPIFIPLNPIRITQFSNKGCDESNFNFSCYRNFTCVINSLSNSFKNQCGSKYNKEMKRIEELTPEEVDKFENSEKNHKIFLEDLVISFPGYYSEYDLLKGGKIFDITNMNLNEKNSSIKKLINDKNVKFISLQINLKVPSNNNYVDVILGLEMNRYFHDIKKIISIDVYNTYRPSTNQFLFSIYNIYFISAVLNGIKLAYEVVLKFIWVVHLFSFLNQIFDVLLIIFLIFYITIDKSILLEIDLNNFESHLIYSSVIKSIKIIIFFV